MKDRRDGTILRLAHGQRHFSVTFNWSPTGRVAECFYCDDGSIKHGSDMAALITDACISISKRAEAGEPFAAIAASFGEDRPPGASCGPPSSLLGAIARAGAALDEEVA
jgi:hypothetical protein